MVNKFGPLAMVYPNGAPLDEKQIEVRDADTGALATLYTSIAATVQMANPTATDDLGMLEFFAEEGAYDIEVTESGFTVTIVVYPPNTTGANEIGEVKTQSSPSATWNFTHGLGRLPTVTIYLPSGEEVEAEVEASATDVYVTWPSPMAGKLVLA
jgi:hypothetical protein